jgi:hypothetical protein
MTVNMAWASGRPVRTTSDGSLSPRSAIQVQNLTSHVVRRTRPLGEIISYRSLEFLKPMLRLLVAPRLFFGELLLGSSRSVVGEVS